jgi:hypothetical protein
MRCSFARLGGELSKSVPIEAYPVTGAHQRDCMPLLQDKRMLVRREELIGDVIRVIADDLRLREADFAS